MKTVIVVIFTIVLAIAIGSNMNTNLTSAAGGAVTKAVTSIGNIIP